MAVYRYNGVRYVTSRHANQMIFRYEEGQRRSKVVGVACETGVAGGILKTSTIYLHHFH